MAQVTHTDAVALNFLFVSKPSGDFWKEGGGARKENTVGSGVSPEA